MAGEGRQTAKALVHRVRLIGALLRRRRRLDFKWRKLRITPNAFRDRDRALMHKLGLTAMA
jgi:hypothetical protein